MSFLYSHLKQLIINGQVNEVTRFFILNPLYEIDINLLYLCVKCNQKDILRLLISRGFPSHIVAENVYYPNEIMRHRTNFDFCRLLLTKGINIESNIHEKQDNLEETVCKIVEEILSFFLTNETYNTNKNPSFNSLIPSFVSESNGCLGILEHLLHFKPDLYSTDPLGLTPLCKSIRLFGHVLVDILLDNGANVNMPTRKNQTALHFAAGYYSDPKSFLKMIELSNNIYAVDNDNCIPLYWAVMKQNCLTTEILLDKYSNINDLRHKMAFCLAILNTETKKTNKQIVRLFTQRHYTLTRWDFPHDLIIPEPWHGHLLSIANDPEYNNVTYLLDRNLSEVAIFQFLVLKATIVQGYLNIFDGMLGANMDLKVYFPKRGSLLHLACEFGRVSIVKELLRRGAFGDIFDGFKMTPLHYAVQGNYPQIVKLLLEEQVNVAAKNIRRQCPLFLACQSSAIKCVRLLLNTGCKVDCPDFFRRSPIHVAAALGNVAMVKLLLKYDVKINVLDGDRKSPLDICLRRNKKSNRKIIELLLHNGAYICNGSHRIYFHIYEDIIAEHTLKVRILVWKMRNFNLNDRRVDVNYFLNKCKSEVEDMNSNVKNGNSIMSLLFKNDLEISLLLKNTKFVRHLRRSNLETAYPTYYPILRARIQKGIMRGLLIELSRHSVRDILQKRTPFYDVIHVDTERLLPVSNVHLRRLILLSSLKPQIKKLVLDKKPADYEVTLEQHCLSMSF